MAPETVRAVQEPAEPRDQSNTYKDRDGDAEYGLGGIAPADDTFGTKPKRDFEPNFEQLRLVEVKSRCARLRNILLCSGQTVKFNWEHYK